MCFSGHRPQKLPFSDDATLDRLKSLIYKSIYDAIREGYTTFICGMARGVDIWAAEAVIDQKRTNPQIKLICAYPYRGHGDAWKGYERWQIAHVHECADEIIYVSEEYTKDCMKRRNCYMVDNS